MDTFKRQFRQNQITLVVLVLAAATGTSALTTWLTTAELSLPQRLKDIALALSITFVAACVSLYYTVRLQIKYLQLHLRLDEVANTDDLTGLPNRRSFVRHGKHRLAADRGSHKKLGLLMVDVDWFKRVNDTYGHAFGDGVIASFGALMGDYARFGRVAGRLGGEEFGLLLPGGEEFTVMCEGDSLEEISAIAEALRRRSNPQASPTSVKSSGPRSVSASRSRMTATHSQPSFPAPTRPSTKPRATVATAWLWWHETDVTGLADV